MNPVTAWQHTIYAYPILFATALSLFLAIYALAYRRRIQPGGGGDDAALLAFAAMNVAVAVWTGFSALKLLSTDPGLQLQFYRLLYFGSSSLGPLLLLFVLAYTGRTRWVRPRVAAGLFLVPVLFWALLFTNPYDLVIASTRVVDVDGLVVLRTTPGPAYIALSFTYVAVIAVGTLALVAVEGIRRGRSQLPETALLSVAIAVPIATSALTSAGVPPFAFDAVNYVPVSAVVSSLALSVATFRYRFLDLRPVAYRTVVDDSPDGVLVLDVTGRVVHANATVASLLGSAAPAVGERIDGRGPLTSVVDRIGADPETVSWGVGTTIELTAETESADFLDVRLRPMRRHGRHLGWVVVFRDVTARLRRERELEAFTSVVSHDLRAPLRTTERYLDLLEERAGDVLDDEATTLLAVGQANSRRGREMVTDLLEYSRIGAGETTFDAVDCDRLVAEVLDALRYRIEERGATVTVGDLPTVQGVEHLLRRLFQNLIVNALVHAGPAPTITLSATREGQTWRFVVRDDGVGIDSNELEYAADLFTQGADVDRDAGMGMGLAICARIVNQHGGELSLDSTPGEGTTASFTLPASESEERED